MLLLQCASCVLRRTTQPSPEVTKALRLEVAVKGGLMEMSHFHLCSLKPTARTRRRRRIAEIEHLQERGALAKSRSASRFGRRDPQPLSRQIPDWPPLQRR